MFIQVDFYKPSGKWYSGDQFEIKDNCFLWSEDFKQEIVDKQNIMQDGWQESDYHVVISDTHADSLSPNYRGFYKQYFAPGSFKGIVKNKECFVTNNK